MNTDKEEGRGNQFVTSNRETPASRQAPHLCPSVCICGNNSSCCYFPSLSGLRVDPLPLVLAQAVVEFAEADSQLGGGGGAVAAVLFQHGEDVPLLEFFQ
ncbi:MAG: hypothetical protein JWO87_1990 [Phycisphaerales bacterium]|nr:hypothetical protein [Phycisphaerales bacterium]